MFSKIIIISLFSMVLLWENT